MPKGFRKSIIILLMILVFSLLFIPVQGYLNLPSEQKIAVGDKLNLGLEFPNSLLQQLSIEINDTKGILKSEKGVLSSIAMEPGEVNLELKLFGLIPFKKINVNIVPNMAIYPGGQAVGVLLRTQGVLIVGQSPIVDEFGNAHFPAKKMGIQVGDIILKVEDQFLETDEQLAKLINERGAKKQKVSLTIKREENIFTKQVIPIYCPETSTYRIGLFVRDNAGGVGTLTFHDPRSGIYGALGHMISDSETNQQIDIKKGKIVRASIEGIKAGKKGQPGEKVGMFIENSDIGNIEINSFCGVFGKLTNFQLKNSFYPQPVPVGFVNQVQTGEAEILTVIEKETIEKFSIVIEKVMTGRRDGKGMVIRITDPILLKNTGGIIQGMSGSPIIQDGKIIGAITHVFINDPTRGYGIFIEDMLSEAGIFNFSTKNLGA